MVDGPLLDRRIKELQFFETILFCFQPFCHTTEYCIHNIIIGKCGILERDNTHLELAVQREGLGLISHYRSLGVYQGGLILGRINVVFCSEKHNFTSGFKTVLVFSADRGMICHFVKSGNVCPSLSHLVLSFVPLCPMVMYGHTSGIQDIHRRGRNSYLGMVVRKLAPSFNTDNIEWIFDGHDCKVDSLFRCLQFVAKLLDGQTVGDIMLPFQSNII